MSRSVDYYFAPQSPWTYLGHARFAGIVKASGASVRVLPIDLGGKVFPISGGLPVGQRPPQRQAYRLVELARFRAALQQVPECAAESQTQVLPGEWGQCGTAYHCR